MPTVRNALSNYEYFGTTIARHNRGGRRPVLTKDIEQAFLIHLVDNPHKLLRELVVFGKNQCGVEVTVSALCKMFKRVRWSYKVMRRVAPGRNLELQSLYQYKMLDFEPSMLIFIDESGSDRRTGFRRKGRAPIGITPVKRDPCNRGPRLQMVGAYGQNGLIYGRVVKGTVDADAFKDFIEYLVKNYCRPWPEDDSVLVMDNASFHHTPEIEEICKRAGVIPVYLSPYCPHLSPIEPFWGEVKLDIKSEFESYFREYPGADYGVFVEWRMNIVGRKKASARGHFRNAGIMVDED